MNKVTAKLECLGIKFLNIPTRAKPLQDLVCSETLSLGCSANPNTRIIQYCQDNWWQNGITLTTPRGTRISRALSKAGFSSDEISLFMKSFSTDTIHISTSINDILRMGTSKHFASCISYKTGVYKTALIWHLLNPDISICFVTDRSGEMKWRVTLVATAQGVKCFNDHGTVYRPYYDWMRGKNITHSIEPVEGFSKIYSPRVRDSLKYNAFQEKYNERSMKIIYS